MLQLNLPPLLPQTVHYYNLALRRATPVYVTEDLNPGINLIKFFFLQRPKYFSKNVAPELDISSCNHQRSSFPMYFYVWTCLTTLNQQHMYASSSLGSHTTSGIELLIDIPSSHSFNQNVTFNITQH